MTKPAPPPCPIGFLRAIEALDCDSARSQADFLRRALGRNEASETIQLAQADPLADADRVAREDGLVVVMGKSLAMEVLLDPEGRYSVNGYNERLKESFGEIYLGLDKGPEYDRQSAGVNAAIMALTAADAFALARSETRRLLSADPGMADAAIITLVLAATSRAWFGIPDERNVVTGPIRQDVAPPPRCPGDYIFISGRVFFASPPDWMDGLGKAHGKLLKAGVDELVKAERAAPSPGIGVLTRAILDNPASADADLAARTIIGVMMGKLPTIYFNLEAALTALRANGGDLLRLLQDRLRAHPASDPLEKAMAVIQPALVAAMQRNPMPPEVWRTAVKPHALGTTEPVKVEVGDTVVVKIAKVTADDLGKGVADAFPVFGGDRRQSPHPTHACPGYRAAIGLMLGVLYGVMEPI